VRVQGNGRDRLTVRRRVRVGAYPPSLFGKERQGSDVDFCSETPSQDDRCSHRRVYLSRTVVRGTFSFTTYSLIRVCCSGSITESWGPSVHRYRYYHSDAGVHFVDPESRRVIYEID